MKSCETIVCVASGPSLNREDCESVVRAGLPVIAVNNSWELVPDCDVVFAGDYVWWNTYKETLTEGIDRWTSNKRAASAFGLQLFTSRFAKGCYNSGQIAIEFAVSRGAQRIILLGYDCSLANGIHWHGKHTKTNNPDANATRRWQGEFSVIDKWATETEIINCSRFSELLCFRRQELEAALAEVVNIPKPGSAYIESDHVELIMRKTD